MKKLILKPLIMACLVVLLTNCQQDEALNENISQEASFQLAQKSFDEFGALPNLYESVISPRKKAALNRQASNKDGTNSGGLYDFTVVKSNVLEYTNKHGVYYTMQVIRPNQSPDYFENLLIVNKYEETPRAFLFRYVPDQQYIANVQNNPFAEFTGETYSRELKYENIASATTSRGQECFSWTTTHCNYKGEEHDAGANCTPAFMYTKTHTVCYPASDGFEDTDDSDGSSGTGTGTGWTPSGGGPNGGNSGGSTSNNDDENDTNNDGKTQCIGGDCPITSPLSVTADIALIQVLGITDRTTIDWLQRHIDIAINLMNYLAINNLDSTSKNVVNSVIDILKTTEVPTEDQLNEIKELFKSLNPILSQESTRSQLMREIVLFNKVLRDYGHADVAVYLDDVIEGLPGFSNEDLYSFYSFMFEFAQDIRATFIVAVVYPYVEVMTQIMTFAFFEIGGNATISILTKLPAVLKTAEILKVIENAKLVSSLKNFKFAQKFGIKSYIDHANFFKSLNIKRSELGVQIHHLIEKRFASILGEIGNNMKSIVLTVEEHKAFTKAWRQRIGYSDDLKDLTTLNATKTDIYKAAREIYKDYPEILRALGL